MNLPDRFFPSASQKDPDAPIRETDNDAALARLSCVRKGYFSDPFIKYFVPRAHLQPPKPPLINIGTYIRSESIDRLVESWVDLASDRSKKCQILSFGAGSDTRFWRLAASKRGEFIAKYIEIDFPEITTRKAMSIRKSKDLSAALGDPSLVSLSGGGTSLRSPVYNLIPADLRWDPSTIFGSLTIAEEGSSEPILDENTPTLLLFECVLVYMSPLTSSSLIAWLANFCRNSAPLAGIVYEMFGLNDQFGRVMRDNLKSRNVELPGVEPYPTLSSLSNRFLEHGFQTSSALTLREIRRSLVSKEELERIARIEQIDEYEELELVLEHYAITWGVLLPDSIKASETFDEIAGGDGAKWLQWRLINL